jgi:hypothetical protein
MRGVDRYAAVAVLLSTFGLFLNASCDFNQRRTQRILQSHQKMKIRIRTNYGVWKLDLEESSSTGAALTINDILTSLSERYKLNTSGIVLVKDSMDPNDTTVTPFERDRTLASYRIHHGDMIKISNKLKKVEVEKSYIEDGHLISAGTSYCADEEDPTTTPPAATVAPPSAAKTSMKEELSQKKIAPVQIPETKPSSKEAREADEDPYAAQVKETPSNVSFPSSSSLPHPPYSSFLFLTDGLNALLSECCLFRSNRSIIHERSTSLPSPPSRSLNLFPLLPSFLYFRPIFSCISQITTSLKTSLSHQRSVLQMNRNGCVSTTMTTIRRMTLYTSLTLLIIPL